MRRAIAIAALLALAVAAWWLWPRGDGVPAAREGAGAADPAGAQPPAGASLKVTTDPKMKVFTRAETLVGTAPESEVRGVVDGPEGAPIGGLRVTARSRMPFRPAATTTTEADGAFRLQAVDDQLLDVSLGGVPEGWTAPSAIARAGGPALRLRLERKKPREPTKVLPVAITVLDGDGKPVAKARVKVQGRFDETNFVTADGEATDAEGVARFDVTEPDAHLWFAVDRPEGRDDVFDMEIDGWKPGDAVVRLDRAVTFSGTVVSGDDGSPAPFAYVVRRDKSGLWHALQADEEGRFEERQLAPGRIQAMAFVSYVEEPFPADARPTDVDPRAGPVKLRIEGHPGWVSVRLAPWKDTWVRSVVIAREARPGVLLESEETWNVEPETELTYRAVSRAGRYLVYAQRGDGRIAFARDLAPGRGDAAVPLEWREGKTIRVSVTWTGRETWRGVPRIELGSSLWGEHVAGRGPPSQEEMQGEGLPFVIKSVPEGTWRVVIDGSNADASFAGEAEIEAGGAGTIEVKELPKPAEEKPR